MTKYQTSSHHKELLKDGSGPWECHGLPEGPIPGRAPWDGDCRSPVSHGQLASIGPLHSLPVLGVWGLYLRILGPFPAYRHKDIGVGAR